MVIYSCQKTACLRTRLGKTKKATSRVVHPADGLGSFTLPKASDGDFNYDPDANYDDRPNNAYYRGGGGNSACEAGEHCQKSQFMEKVLEMQGRVFINLVYIQACRVGIWDLGAAKRNRTEAHLACFHGVCHGG